MVVPSGLPTERYRQLSRSQNMRHSSVFYVQFTLADFLYKLWTEFNRLRLTERKVTAAMVAETLSGNGKYELASITQAAQTAMRLPMAVIECVKELADTKNLEMCLERERLNIYSVKNLEKLATVGDC